MLLVNISGSDKTVHVTRVDNGQEIPWAHLQINKDNDGYLSLGITSGPGTISAYVANISYSGGKIPKYNPDPPPPPPSDIGDT